MCSEPEMCSVRDFARALRLLHSPEPGSTEKLRVLLNVAIAQRYGSGKSIPAGGARERVDNASSRIKSEEESDGEAFTDSVGNSVGGKDEVPRISIPDEEHGESLTCRVCNVPEFGPLILIKCRGCSELYHPLCHQPSVVDAQGPDFNWRCSQCDNRSSLEEARRDTGSTGGRGVTVRVKQYTRRARKQTESHNGSSEQ
ncbi:integrator complex subunit 12-like [Copidosoma floridanum]|uniref:integrator complex subunit 12-like n=1 Tax=Copidosoma floridanum TaxID=29053 RepID=UPI000C6F763D|nr:integrator complex subunit 12-like [Copidosoma floridanum]